MYLVYLLLNSNSNNLKVYFLDVGQGDSVLFVAPNGNKLLYDGGPQNGKVYIELSNIMKIFFDDIDIFIASHPDSDHIGGFASIFSYKPKYYIDNHKVNFTSDFSTLEKLISTKNIKRLTAVQGEFISLGSGVYVNILSPENDVSDFSNNSSSVSILVSFGKSKILLTGDMEIESEDRLVREYGLFLDSEILKAGHHGAKTSTGDKILKATTPKYVVISADKNNRYGHPHESTMQRIKLLGADIVETSKLGSIAFECNLEGCIKK